MNRALPDRIASAGLLPPQPTVHRFIVLLIMLIGLRGPAANGQPVRYDGHRVVRVEVTTEHQQEMVRTLSDDLFSEHITPGQLDVRLSPHAFRRLQHTGLPFTVLIEDVQEQLDRQRTSTAGDGDGWYDGYRSWGEIVSRLEHLATLYPDLLTLWPIGESIEGRPIYAARIDRDQKEEPVVLLTAGQHAREWLAPMVVMYVLERMLESARKGESPPRFAELEFLFVPMVNPDGYVFSWEVDPMWRKNRRDHGDEDFGVDLNRNWAHEWAGPGSSDDPASDVYHGAGPFSEPECQAVRDLVSSTPSIVAFLDYHGFGRKLLHPWASDASEADPYAAHDALGRELVTAIARAEHDHYLAGSFAQLLYAAGGTSMDWMWDERMAFSYTVELSGGFIPPPDEIALNGDAQFNALGALCDALTAGVVWEFPGATPPIVGTDESSCFRLRATPLLGSALLPDSAALHWRMDPDRPFSPALIQHEDTASYRVVLPPTACGRSLDYYLEISAESGTSFVSPPDAPESFYSSHVRTIRRTFADSFEDDLRWSVTAEGRLSEGAWVRGIPVGHEQSAPPLDADGSGQCYLTGAIAGEDVDGGATVLTSPMMDASDPGSVVSYYRWFSNMRGAFPQSDAFLVEVSDDGGVSWITLETIGPSGPHVNGGWVRREFMVEHIPGITGTRFFRIRFTASDHGLPATVEAAVDGVELRIYETCAESPADLDQDGIVGYADLLVLLSVWGACPPPPQACPGDLDGDGVVSMTDLVLLMSG